MRPRRRRTEAGALLCRAGRIKGGTTTATLIHGFFRGLCACRMAEGGDGLVGSSRRRQKGWVPLKEVPLGTGSLGWGGGSKASSALWDSAASQCQLCEADKVRRGWSSPFKETGSWGSSHLPPPAVGNRNLAELLPRGFSLPPSHSFFRGPLPNPPHQPRERCWRQQIPGPSCQPS